MVELNIELLRNDQQSIVIELVDSDGLNIDVGEIDRIVMWVKPPFQDKLFPVVEVRGPDTLNGLGRHLAITFGHELLARQMWTQARYGIEVTDEGKGPTTIIGGKIIRKY